MKFKMRNDPDAVVANPRSVRRTDEADAVAHIADAVVANPRSVRRDYDGERFTIFSGRRSRRESKKREADARLLVF